VSGAGSTVASRGGNANQEVAIGIAGVLLDGFPGTHGHHVISPADQIDASLGSFRQFHPGRSGGLFALIVVLS
jgi:hypothetical protein